MINLSDLKSSSEHVRKYASTLRCSRQGVNTWRVTPKVGGKASRLVEFVKFGQWKVRCSELHTGEPCPANQFGNLCAHVYAVIKQFEKESGKQKLAA
jgi:hypothetical protein